MYSKGVLHKEQMSIDIIIPQESPSYHKLPTHIAKWQPYLNPIHYSVLSYLVSRIHKKKHYAYPSIRTAAEECNICENSFDKAIKTLEALELIFVFRSSKGNRYYLKPPLEPNFESISKNLPKKALEKFKKRTEKNNDSQLQNSLSFSKIHYFEKKTPISKEADFPSNDDKKISQDDTHKPHQMTSKQNSLNSKFKQHKQNSNSESTQQNNFAVVDMEKVKKLKGYGITSKKAVELVEIVSKDIDFDNFIHYILFDVGKYVNIKSTSGFLIHGIENLQDDFLESKLKKESEKKKSEKKKLFLEQCQDLKLRVEKKAVNILDKMSVTEQKELEEKVKLEYPILREKDYQDEFKEAFYLEYIKLNILTFDTCELALLNDGNISEKELSKLQKLMDELSI